MNFMISSTVERIKYALFEDLKDKPFREINNNEIIKTAEISSRTFYRYYKDKNDLLNKIEDELISELKDNLEKSELPSDQEATIASITNNIMKVAFQFCYQNKDAVKVLLSQNGDLLFWVKMKLAIRDKFQKDFSANFKNYNLKSANEILLFDSFLDSKLVFIVDWLNYTDKVSAHDALNILNKATLKLE